MGNRSGHSQTVARSFDRRRNSLNAIRLLLAVLVVVSHSWAIGGFGPEPSLGGAHLGTWSVLGFFCISGYLITASRLGSTSARFYKARALRILPGFVVCLIVVAAVLAPLSTLGDGIWSFSSAVTYVVRNLALYPPGVAQDGIENTLTSVPYIGMWDGSLWTLFWEACCYVLVGVGVSVVPRIGLFRTVTVAFFGVTALCVLSATGLVTLPGIGDRVLPLVAAFLAGAVVFLAADRIPVTTVTISVALAWVAVVVGFGMVQALGGLPLAFLLLVIGSRSEASAIGRQRDLSYGFYIYAWPVQQILVLLLDGRGGVLVLIGASLVVTWLLAFLSCILIERPALRLVGARTTSSVPIAPVP
jgi:peptidoglycan/LPS O-acetylase OafA/YrhL